MNTAELKRRVTSELATLEMLESRQMLSADLPRDVVGVLHPKTTSASASSAGSRRSRLTTRRGSPA